MVCLLQHPPSTSLFLHLSFLHHGLSATTPSKHIPVPLPLFPPPWSVCYNTLQVHPCSFISLSSTMVCLLQHHPSTSLFLHLSFLHHGLSATTPSKYIPVPSSLFPPPWSVCYNTLQVHPCSFISLSSTMVCLLQHPPSTSLFLYLSFLHHGLSATTPSKYIPVPSSLFPPPWSVCYNTIQVHPCSFISLSIILL